AILATVGLGCLRVSRKGQRIMKSARQIGSALALSLTLVSIAGATVTNDRIYLFGDDTFETGATAGNPMGIDFGGGPLTLDSEVADTTSPLVDAQDLTVVGAPTYILVDGNDVGGLPARPGAGLGTL